MTDRLFSYDQLLKCTKPIDSPVVKTHACLSDSDYDGYIVIGIFFLHENDGITIANIARLRCRVIGNNWVIEEDAIVIEGFVNSYKPDKITNESGYYGFNFERNKL